MPRSPSSVTQADLARAIRAAKQEGWQSVRVITPSGAVIEIGEVPAIHSNRAPEPQLEPLKVI